MSESTKAFFDSKKSIDLKSKEKDEAKTPKYKRNALPQCVYIVFIIVAFASQVLSVMTLREDFLRLRDGLDVREGTFLGVCDFLRFLFAIFATCYLLFRKNLFDTSSTRERVLRLWPFWLSYTLSIVVLLSALISKNTPFLVLYLILTLNETLFMVEAMRPGAYAGFLSNIYRPWVGFK